MPHRVFALALISDLALAGATVTERNVALAMQTWGVGRRKLAAVWTFRVVES